MTGFVEPVLCSYISKDCDFVQRQIPRWKSHWDPVLYDMIYVTGWNFLISCLYGKPSKHILTTQALSKIFFDFWRKKNLVCCHLLLRINDKEIKWIKFGSQTLSLWMSNASAFCKISDELCILSQVFYVIQMLYCTQHIHTQRQADLWTIFKSSVSYGSENFISAGINQ